MDVVSVWLEAQPPYLIFIIVGLVIGLESMGIPLPGELTLVTAALMSSTGAISPWGVATGAAIGAVIGDSIGYTIGRRGGRVLLEKAGRRFPRHFGPPQLAKAEDSFARWGVWAVFFGRFIALLRILAGPIAGALHIPYYRFLLANASGGIVWAYGTTFTIFYVGKAAERWLSGFAWIALAIAVISGIVTSLYLKRRTRTATASPLADCQHQETTPTDSSNTIRQLTQR